MKTYFENVSIKEFNERFNCHLKESWHDNGDFYEELNHQLEDSKTVAHFFTSMDKKDVIEDIIAINNLSLELNLIEVENVYVALSSIY